MPDKFPDKPVKVALFRELRFGWFTVFEFNEHTDGNMNDYVRVSEPIEVTFAERTRDEVIRSALAVFDSKEQELYAKCQREVDELHERKKELLTLTFKPEASAA
jgi:hypothetical protein